ncbi:MAG TPA: circularly permuted type 2 ATP-grasp protein, partial [Aeromicrobium sp.]|nr:circularly permuted type 2 ATP-grasp protein [Aeromicrobium sp.]
MTALRDYAAGLNQPQLSSSGPRYDEVVGDDGALRAGWTGLGERAVQVTRSELARVGAEVERFLADDGVTYRPAGTVDDGVEAWRLDPIPLIFSAEEWAALETGLAQRAELLNAIAVDLYGPQRLLSSGLLPPQAVFGHSGFLRVAARRSARTARPLLVTATDLGRNADGEWVVMADRAQAPSGIGYAMENRRVISRVLPDLYRRASLHRIAPFFQALRATLIEAAPESRPNPRVVVLSPGTESETAFDQAFVASSLGF